MSRVSTSKRSIKANRPLNYMRMTFRQAHNKFKEEYPTIEISFSSFYHNVPEHVKPLHMTPLDACQCVFCSNINLKLKILKLRGIANEIDLYRILLCVKKGKLRDFNCIEGKCKKCKDWKEKIEQHASELDMTKEISWQTWEYIKYRQKKTGKDVSKRVLVNKEGTIRKCLDEFINIDVLKPGKNREYTFVKHFFTQSVQFQMYQDCKASLKPGQCLVIQDFAQNFEIAYRSEIKASNWSKRQITVHPHVIYHMTSNSDVIQRKVIVHLSDIIMHDAHMVYHMTQDVIDILSKMHPDEKWNKVYLWSDGSSSQYKGKKSFYYLNKFKVPIERNYFGTEHGKNECDATTGMLKLQYNNAIKADDCVISNAHDLTEYFIETYKNDKSKFFRHVHKDDKDLLAIFKAFESVNVQVLSGACTRTLHQIKAGKGKGCMLTRPFSCFCTYCLTNDLDKCINKKITGGNFTERRLDEKHDKISNESDDDDDDDNDDGDDIDDIGEVDDSGMKELIRIENQNIKESDLQINDIIIVPLKDFRKKVFNFPAKVIELGENGDINIDYLKQDFDKKWILLESTSEKEKNWIITIKDVIMKLPKYTVGRRGQYIFSGKIDL